jgi:thioredoxin reductase
MTSKNFDGRRNVTLLDLTPRPPASPELAAHPVVVIGAGPIGLAAAANLLEHGIDSVILEAGPTVGASIREWGHTRLFSPWEFLVDPASRRLLETTGWVHPKPTFVPTGHGLVAQYLDALAAHPQIASRLQTGSAVIGVSRRGMDRTRSHSRAAAPYIVRVRTADGVELELLARAVIDASGTFGTPNPLGANGLDPLGIDEVADRVLPALPDVLGAHRERFAGRHTTVVGAGHSAANTLISLGRLQRDDPSTTISWLIRSASAQRITSSDDDQLAGRALLGTRVDRLVASGAVRLVDGFEISAARADGSGIVLVGTRDGRAAEHGADLVVSATGFRPDLGILREIRLELDDVVEAPRRLAPLIDPNHHSCGTVEPHGFRELAHPDAGMFIVGMKSYGRAPTFLLATGYEQVRSVVAWIAGDLAAATTVRLELPATGVCSTDGLGGACCS